MAAAFGYKGFDTASSIALLAASAIAKKRGDAKRIPPADIIILPVASPFVRSFLAVGTDLTPDLDDQLLFTVGMTLIDSIDSILMLYSYTGFPEQRFRLFEPAQENEHPEQESSAYREAAATTRGSAVQLPRSQSDGQNNERHSPTSTEVPPTLNQQSGQGAPPAEGEPVKMLAEDEDALVSDIRKKARKELIVKRNMMSGLSIVLTLMSIIVAFRCVCAKILPTRTRVPLVAHSPDYDD
jgi:high-affinity nickel-transport protein